ncbi:Ribonuclease BN-like family [Metamycoplasma arthritidis]|uniref:Ribonuclease BN-like family enzyme n=1 Tax=Metamycoplasma arthritidis (strain 158L3-1) TaxID=243272 RepID=B3PLT1_META1|nr:YihY/virulence factor BrkB family protein [Metamycoplasma arthritidis]ACF06983.1 ribonuclease BN-like family enzyme [Metamycoplasma arthritidis 158L3-1]VEU78512.1 Ribonuclease BN-like family [Metamycoplasma arthritidis]
MSWFNKKKKKKLQTGWQTKDDKNNGLHNSSNIASSQIIESKKSNNIFERITKWIIYAILFIAIPRHLKSSKSKGREIVNSAYKKINSNEFAFIPAGYAMYLFLSFIPIACLLLSVIGPISPEYNAILKLAILGRIIPGVEKVLPDMASIWNSAGGAITLILFALSVIWLSSKGYAKFVHSIDALYEHKSPQRAWKNRIKGVFLGVLIAFGLTILLLAFTAFMSFLAKESAFGDLSPATLSKENLTLADLKLRWEFWLVYYFSIIITLPIVTYLGFLIFFKLAPNFKIKIAHVHPGALITAIPTSVFILIFGSLTSIIPYGKFGPVAAFMYLILLMVFMSYFIYVGVIVNATFYKTFINLPIMEKSKLFKHS